MSSTHADEIDLIFEPALREQKFTEIAQQTGRGPKDVRKSAGVSQRDFG
jgi:hypothetical protein